MQARILKWQGLAKGRALNLAQIEAHQREEAGRELKRRQAEKTLRQVEKLPRRFIGKCWDDFKIDFPAQSTIKKVAISFVKTFEGRSKEGSSLIFSGNTGTGKTLLACVLHQSLSNDGHECGYEHSLGFLKSLQEKKFESDAAFKNSINYYRHLPFLVLDEIAEGHGKGGLPAEWEQQMLFTVIDARYQEGRGTLAITNRNKAGLIQRCGERVVDRLAEKGTFLSFNWGSYRK